MKKIYLALMPLICTLFFSCENVMDIHQEYIKDGEIIYATKLDTTYFVAGNGRVQFNYRIFNAPNVEFINVYWNDFQDSLAIPVNLIPDTVKGTQMITNLEEKAYTFYAQTEDKYGNKSLMSNGFASSYGEKYQATLTNRRVRNLSVSATGGTINWYSGADGLVKNEIRYTDKSGNIQTVAMPANEGNVYCPNVQPRGSFEYRSAYIPEIASVDTFYTAWVMAEERFPYQFTDVDRSRWEVVFYDNSDEHEGSVANMFDNNPDSYWHSDYHNTTHFPYTFIIDMKETLWVGEFGAQPRQGVHYSKGIEFYIKETYNNDPQEGGWTKLGDFDLPQNNDFYWKICPDNILDLGLKARYLKVVFTSGHNNEHLGAIAEIAVKKVVE